MTIYELEERVQKLEHLVHGDVKNPGILPLVVGIAEDLHGVSGDGGIKKTVEQSAQELRDMKVERRTAMFILAPIAGLVGSIITLLVSHFLK